MGDYEQDWVVGGEIAESSDAKMLRKHNGPDFLNIKKADLLLLKAAAERYLAELNRVPDESLKKFATQVLETPEPSV